MTTLPETTDMHSDTIVCQVRHLIHLRDTVLEELFSLFPAQQPNFREAPISDPDKLTAKHVESIVYGAGSGGVHRR